MLADPGDRSSRANLTATPGDHVGDAPHVLLRPTDDGAPLRGAEDTQHPVMLQEREQVTRRVAAGRLRITGPHGSHQRRHEVPHEILREPSPAQELLQGLVLRGARFPCRQETTGPAVETQDLHQHPQIRRTSQVPPVSEQSDDTAGAGVLQPRAAVRVVGTDRQGHLRRSGADTQIGEQAQQHRVGAVVVHDEPGVDVHLTTGGGDGRGVGVSPGALVGVVQGDLRPSREFVGGGQPADARADHGDTGGARGSGHAITSRQCTGVTGAWSLRSINTSTRLAIFRRRCRRLPPRHGVAE
jgi:hypothetical protein